MQLDATDAAPAPAPTNNDTAKIVDEATVKALENVFEQLQAELQKEECCNCKATIKCLSNDFRTLSLQRSNSFEIPS
jgi:hypothetical protein